MAAEKFTITTAIDYVNAQPHLGHAYEKVCADVIARWHRLKGQDVFFLTGTDENAQKNVKAAEMAGVPTQKFVDQNVQVFKDLCQRLKISHDYFIRTTEEHHHRISQDLFKKMQETGDIYKGKYEGLYCTGCEEFKTEKDLVSGKCPEHGAKPEWLSEESYFFKMSRYEKDVTHLIESGEMAIFPGSKKNEMLSRIRTDGLRDLAVSREKTTWGVEVPGDSNHRIYVWFDALINYISALDYPSKKYQNYWPADMHVIGKGINWFHSVIWPAMLFSAGIPQPKKIVVHGYVNVKGKKMSKSTGTVVDPLALIEKYGADPLRYFLIRDIPFGEDGDFSEEALKQRINGELLSDLGNLVSRVLTLCEKNNVTKFEGSVNISKKCETFIEELKKNIPQLDKVEIRGGIGKSKIPGNEKIEIGGFSFRFYLKRNKVFIYDSRESPSGSELVEFCELIREFINIRMERLELHKAIEDIFTLVARCNKYINETEPWKKEGKELGNILYNLVEGLRIIAILISPFVPGTAEKINKQLGVKPGMLKDARFKKFSGKPKKGQHLFERIV